MKAERRLIVGYRIAMHEVPDDYIVPEQLPLMLEATTDVSETLTIVGEAPHRLIRDTKPFVREFSISSVAPSREHQTRSRFILWRPVGATTIPKGWVRSPIEVSVVRATGFMHIHPDYKKGWSKSARYLLSKLPERHIRIEQVPYEVYARVLPSTGKFKSIHDFMSRKARRFNRVYGEAMRWYLAYTKEGVAVSGLGILYLPEHNYSFHVSGFTDRRFDEPEANVGLIDRWHQDLLALGMTYIDFGTLWRPGDPKSWKGFADFKKKFGVRLVYLPQTYVTFVPSVSLAAWLQRVRRLFSYRSRTQRASQ